MDNTNEQKVEMGRRKARPIVDSRFSPETGGGIRLWEVGHLRHAQFRAALSSLPTNITDYVTKVKRVIPEPPQRPYYLLSVKASKVQLVHKRLRTHTKSKWWGAFVNDQRRMRSMGVNTLKRKLNARKKRNTNAPDRVKVWAYNRKGGEGNKGELIQMIRENKLDVLALSEQVWPKVWPLMIPGYMCVHGDTKGEENTGAGDVGLIINKKLCPVALRCTINTLVIARVQLKQGPCVVASFYNPPSGRAAVRRKRLRLAVNAVNAVNGTGQPMILLGDFNMTSKQVIKELNKVESGWWENIPCNGTRTFYKGGKVIARKKRQKKYAEWVKQGAQPDHIFLHGQWGESSVSKCTVVRTHQRGDHWPIQMTVSCVAPDSKAKVELRWKKPDQAAWSTVSSRFADHNLFTALCDKYDVPDFPPTEEEEATTMHQMDPSPLVTSHPLEALRTTTIKVAGKMGIRVLRNKRVKGLKDPQENVARAAQLRRAALRKFRGSGEKVDLKAFQAARKKVKEVIADNSKEHFKSFLAKGLGHLSSNRAHEFWAWLGTMYKGRTNAADTSPLRNNSGKLCTTESDIRDAWVEWYKKLFDEANPETAAEWDHKCKQTGSDQKTETQRKSLNELGNVISWSEIQAVLEKANPWKSGFPGGLPSWAVKLFMNPAKEDGQLPFSKEYRRACPRTAAGKFFMHAINHSWVNGDLPEEE